MPTRRPIVLAALAAATLAACSDAPTSVPDLTGGALAVAPPVGAASQDTATGQPPAPAPATPDTTRPVNFPASARVEGRVLLPTVGDGSPTAPAPGARLTLFRNQLVNGEGVSTRVAETTAGADASFAFDDVPGGYLVLAVNVTPERPWGTHVAFLLVDASVHRVTVPFWTRP